jgi:hypothetical protein
MTTNLLAPVARQRTFTDLGVVAPGAKLYTYVSGTPATPLATTSDAAGLVPNTNPIVASAGGLFGPIYLTPDTAYHFVLTDAIGLPLWDQDPVTAPSGGSTAAPITYLPPRVVRIVSSPTPAPSADTTDLYAISALTTPAAFALPAGTPVNGQKLIIRIKDDGTARGLTWDAGYVAGGVALPTTTVAGKILHLGWIYNTDNALNKWMLVASAQEA